MKLAFLLLAGLFPAAAQLIDIVSPVPYLVAGDTQQLSAAARTADNTALTGITFFWKTSDAGILAVDDQGTMTGTGLGSATVTVTSSAPGTGFGSLIIQVVPQAITIAPVVDRMFLGDTLQLTATALDRNNAPVSNAPIVWRVTAENGTDSATASVSASGLVSATGTGVVTIHAGIDYGGTLSGKAPFIEALASLRVVLRPSFLLTRQLSNAVAQNAVQIRPSPGALSANDAGQVASTVSLDALATGVVLFEGGKLRLLASAGTPSVLAGGDVAGFQSVAMNQTGQVLVSVQSSTSRTDGALLLGTRDGLSPVLLEGNRLSPDVQGLSFLFITQNSLNDSGTVVFRALYTNQNGDVSRNGLFTLDRFGLRLYWSGTPAADLILDSPSIAGWDGPTGFGIDNSGVLTFVVQAGSSRTLYRLDTPGAAPQKILGIGDAFLKSTVKLFTDLRVLANGDAVLRVDLNNGEQHIVRFANGIYKNDLLVHSDVSFRVLAASPTGVLFYGAPSGAAKPLGLYRWVLGAASTVDAMVIPGGTGPDAVASISAASLSTQNTAVVTVLTAASDFTVLAANTAANLATTKLFEVGTALNLMVTPDLQSIVSGPGAGNPNLVVGKPSSTFQLGYGTGVLTPRVLLGQRMPDGSGYSTSTRILENAAGTLVFDSRGAIYAMSPAGAITTLMPASSTASDGVKLLQPKPWAVNLQGDVVVETITDKAYRRLYLLSGGKLTLLEQTAATNGGITDWKQIALDDRGRVMAYLVVQSTDPGFAQGYFLYSGGKRTGTLFFSPAGAQAGAGLKAAGNNFYALLSPQPFAVSNVSIFDASTTWKALVKTGQRLPNGETMSYIQGFDVNPSGTVVFYGVVEALNSRIVCERSTVGTLSQIYVNSDPTDAGDYLYSVTGVNIRSSGRVWISGLDLNDYTVVYAADPI